MTDELWPELQPTQIVYECGGVMLAVYAQDEGTIAIRYTNGENDSCACVGVNYAEDFLRAFFLAWKQAAVDRVEFFEVLAGGKVEEVKEYPEGTFDLSAPVDSASRGSPKGRGQVIKFSHRARPDRHE